MQSMEYDEWYAKALEEARSRFGNGWPKMEVGEDGRVFLGCLICTEAGFVTPFRFAE